MCLPAWNTLYKHTVLQTSNTDHVWMLQTITFLDIWNKPINDNYTKLLSNYNKIIFGKQFNQPVDFSKEQISINIREIVFGSNFNKPVYISRKLEGQASNNMVILNISKQSLEKKSEDQNEEQTNR